MPYNYIGLGGARTKSDLQTMGAFSGSSMDIITSPCAPYPNGRALLTNKAATAATAVPGQATDYFSYQLSSKTSGELYSEGRGWAVYWRSMLWVDNSVTSSVTFDGTNWWMPASGAAPGNFIGQSPDGLSWNFVEIPGAHQNIANPTATCAFKGVFGFTKRISTTLQEMWYLSNGEFVPATIIEGINTYFRDSVATDEILALCGYGGVIVHATDIAGPYTAVDAGTSHWNQIINLPGTSTWLTVGTAGTVGRTTDDFSTFNIQTLVSTDLYGVAASPTSVIAVGVSNECWRSVDQGATWTKLTNLPATLGTAIMGAAYGNGTYVIGSNNSSYLAVSTDDGLTWTDVLSPTDGTTNRINGSTSFTRAMDGLKFQGGKFWICTAGNTQNNYILACSEDGFKWETVITVYPKGSTSYYNSVNGIFLAQNSSGSPVSASTGAGYTLSAGTNYTSYPILCLGNVNVGNVYNIAMGVNQWHEYQLVGRPAATPNEWDITYIIDGVDYGTYQSSNYALQADSPIWFNIHRSNYFALTSDVVYYDFKMDDDPGLLGPDLRVYYDQPATDVSVQWLPAIPDASNAEMVAVTSITDAITYVSEDGTPKTDQYTMQSTNVPDEYKILSTKNEAYFSRLQSLGGIRAQVGISIGGVTKDSIPQDIASPVNSWTYLSQQLDNNPQTGQAWTKTKLDETQLRIRRASPSPGGDPYWSNVVLLAHFTGINGQITFVDSSNTQTLKRSGLAALSDAQFKFAPTSLALNPTSVSDASFIEVPFNDSLIMDSGDFTLESWVYQTFMAPGVNTIFSFGNGGTVAFNYFYWGISGGNIRLIRNVRTSIEAFYVSESTVPLNQWVHVAVQRKNGTITSYINGVQDSVSVVNTSRYNVATGYACIGRAGSTDSGYRFRGYLQDLRITKGVARYDGSFTVPDAPYPDYY